MTTNVHGGSATIYQFPLRGRFASNGDLDQAKAASKAMPQYAQIAYGSSWYHDEAIEAERPRKN